jgi:membrane protein
MIRSIRSPIRAARSAAARVREFFLTGLWRLAPGTLPPGKAVAVRLLRPLTMAVAEFIRDQCMLRASALTFYTLMSVVPVFAVIFGAAKGFGLEKLLEKELMERLSGQEEVIERILAFSRSLLDNTQGGLMAGVGVLVMFWSAIKVLGQIESALNAMWDVRKSRTWVRKFTDYLALMIIGPFLLLAAGSATVFIRTQIGAAADYLHIAELLGPLVIQAMKIGSLVLIWALFTLIYMAMPNTRVPFRAALAGGILGGSLFYLAQSIYIGFQIGVARNNAIYGSFAALPLLFFWVQTSWTLVLFGAEFCYAFQHAASSCSATGCPALSPASKKLLGLRIARCLARNFGAGGAPLTVSALARETKTPHRLVEQVVDELQQGGILSETRMIESQIPAYQPAFDIQRLTIQNVLDALDKSGEPIPGDFSSEDTRGLEDVLRELSRAAAEAPANRLLKDV